MTRVPYGMRDDRHGEEGLDHVGSPRLVVNAVTGAVVAELRYTAFGRVLLDTNSGFQPFGLAGGLYDPDVALTRFGVRDLDSRTGVFA